MSRNIIRYQVVYLLLAVLLCLAVIANVNTGSVSISPVEIFQIIFLQDQGDMTLYNIIWKIRLPRMLSAGILGGGLSVAGFLIQTFFRNPIAGPFVLGISSGAKMFVGFTLLVLLGQLRSAPLSLIILASFMGSLLSMGMVLLFARAVKNMSMLLVVGIMIGYICTAITDFFVVFAKESDIANLTYWSMGSFSGIGWENLKVAAAITITMVVVTLFFSKPIGAYQLGEGYAQSMGINIKVFRAVLILLSSMLSACVTAFAGPVSFVGIAVPHMAKLLLNSTKPLLVIPTTFFCGAVFCMFCDLLARTLFAPVELAIGTVTAVFGAPVVIWLMVSRKKQA